MEIDAGDGSEELDEDNLDIAFPSKENEFFRLTTVIFADLIFVVTEGASKRR